MIRSFVYMMVTVYLPLFALDEIPVNYQLMDRQAFENVVVGNTLVGTTHYSHSLYMIYFLPEGECHLWKQNQIYSGQWWIETNQEGNDYIRAFWPEYFSTNQKSLFSPENPRYGHATHVRYY